MFDDLLSAATLFGVSATFVAAVATGLGPTPSASQRSAAMPGATTAMSPQAPVPAVAAASMPIYDLPRVVITGNRLRDGDVLAENREATPLPFGTR
jgi:hypothetical protein